MAAALGVRRSVLVGSPLCRLWLAVLVATAASIGGVARAQDGVVRVALFTADWCAHCVDVKRRVLPPLRERHGDHLEIRDHPITDPAAYAVLLRLEEARALPPDRRGVPTAFLGDRVFVGSSEIERELPVAIEAALAAGGAGWPADYEEAARPIPTSAGTAPIHLLFFHQTGCRECSRARADLGYLAARHPQLRVEERNVYDDAALASWLAHRAGRELRAPAAFVGQTALIGPEEVSARRLEEVVAAYEPEGAPAFWVGYAPDTGEAQLVERFRGLGPLAVVLAGLVDGINPCAFATLIFFVSYLTVSGRRGRAVLAAGTAFTVGVFLTYLAVGLGMYRLLDLLGGAYTVLGRALVWLTAVGCLLLAAYSFRDFLAARRGDLDDMKLVLPDALKDRIRARVRKGKTARFFVATALVTGAVVSLLELACTGQVYLPTIIFMTSVPELQARAVAYLVLYNLLFVLPLVVVFVLVYMGTTSLQLTGWLRRHAKETKLALTILFTLLAVWLVVSTLG